MAGPRNRRCIAFVVTLVVLVLMTMKNYAHGEMSVADMAMKSASERLKKAKEDAGRIKSNLAPASGGGRSSSSNGKVNLSEQEQTALKVQKKKQSADIAAVAARDAARADGAKLREDARKRAVERMKAQQEGTAMPPQAFKQQSGPNLATESVNIQRDNISREERRALEQEHKRVLRVRALADHHEHRVKLSKVDDLIGRRILQEMAPPKHCGDGEKNDAETDVDCGGDRCREEMVLIRGLEFPRTCHFAQACEINKDCSSFMCVDKRCAPHAPLAPVGNDAALLRLLHSAFFAIANDANNGEYISASDLHRFLSLAVNPDSQEMSAAQTELFDNSIQSFAKEQGLATNPNLKVTYGFLTRGRPLALVKQLLAAAQKLSLKAEL